MLKSFFLRQGLLVGAFLSATQVFAADFVQVHEDSLEVYEGGCGEAAFTFPSITLTPLADVVVGTGDEFAVQKVDSEVVIKHVGEAQSVRFPSIVSVGANISLILERPGTSYCIDSAVATLGGHIKIRTADQKPVRIISAVGDVISG